LKSKGLNVRVFGEPMDFWSDKMPQGMLLRSPREASNISGPTDASTLEAFEAATGTKPCAPVPLETFVNYGLWFQQQLGSCLDRQSVERVEKVSSGFEVTLQNGETFRSRRVVVATGIGPFQRKPAVFRTLPAEKASHCYEGTKIQQFVGKRVVVIGAGQSALESAALLHELGAEVEVITRNPFLRWVGMHRWIHQMGPISKILYSKYDVGPAGISRLVASPKLMSWVPLDLRDKIRTRAVRAAGARWLPARLAPVKMALGRTVESATTAGENVHLRLDDGSERSVDHVLLGTGYDVDISRYEFISETTSASISRLDGYPKLESGFRSSVPGLHFVGATAARSFGPLLYFVAGTEFASRELTSYIATNRNHG
jgi:thioredoxin reductase